jgi:carbamoyl-phosphate synthase large subunit
VRVLITCAGGPAAEDLVRHWARHEVYVSDMDPLACPPPSSHHWDSLLPGGDDPEYLPALRRLCYAQRIDMVVPLADEELLKAQCVPGVQALCPQSFFVKLALDKFHCMRALNKLGLAPATWLLSECARNPQPLPFNVVVKPRSGRGGRHVMVLASKGAVDAYLTVTGLAPEQVLVQEHVQGQEYTVTVVADVQARLKAIVPIRVNRKRGITLHGTTEHAEPIVDACRRIHQEFPTRGTYNVQCIWDGTRVAVFEINPRISTTVSLVLAAGVDPLELFYGDGRPGLAWFRDDLTLMRRWSSHFVSGKPQHA